MNGAFSGRRLAAAAAVLAMMVAAGTIGFHVVIDESWLDALYRTVVASSLTGLDTTPTSAGGQLLTIFLVLGAWLSLPTSARSSWRRSPGES